MALLDFIYFVVYSVSLSRDRSDLRFNPAAFIVMIIQPVINSAIGMLVELFTRREPIVAGSKIFYARFDAWTYISIVLAAVISWLFFDRKRTKILANYSGLVFRKSTLWSVAAAASLYIFLGFYLYTVDYFLAVLVFVGLVLIGNFWVRSRTLKY